MHSVPPIRHQAKPFLVDLINVERDPPNADSVRLDIYLAVPYSSVSFLYAVDKYVADYGVVIEITDKQATSQLSKIVEDKYQTFSIVRPTTQYKSSGNESDRADASQYSFVLAADHSYDVRIAVRDLSNQHEHDSTYEFHTRKFLKTIQVSDLIIYRTKKGNQILPNIGSEVSALPQYGAGLFAELYHSQASTPYGVLVRLLGSSASHEELGRWSSTVVGTGAERIPMFQPFELPELWLGTYRMELSLFADPQDTQLRDDEQIAKRRLAVASRQINESLQHGMPIALEDIDEAIDQVALIARPSELDSLRDATTPTDKRRALAEFWRKHRPFSEDRGNASMDVFYRRVQYANENFRGSQHGWRTDQGRIYIQLGAPTYIDKHPYEVNQKPYEVWEYHDLSTRYVFIDQYMLGDYRLVSAPPPSNVYLWERESY
jgi:GWxTD domain-containing protein